MSALPATFLDPAGTARVAADVYGVSLVATIPLIAVWGAYYLLRASNAGTRAIMWRCTVIGLLAIYAGRFVPWQWMAWVLPEPLARPLVSLGTIDLETPPGLVGVGAPGAQSSPVLPALIVLYWSVVSLILLRTVVARGRLALVRRRAMTLGGARWRDLVRDAGDAVGVSTSGVQLAVSSDVAVPVTWGVWRPVVLLPLPALQWPVDQLQAVVRHELSHVLARDSAMRLAARVACALFWFHPGAWWAARRFEADAEEASDDRVLLSGIRASDYAEWLGASVPQARDTPQAVMAFVRRSELRARLAVVTNPHRDLVVPGRRLALFAAAFTAVLVIPLATARLAPTREVLTSMMGETRWESRAWAVVHLAKRADSVDVARSAATYDPDPAVRAWARYALGLSPVSPNARRRS